MNKKFTTLLASAMLATAFSANAKLDVAKGASLLLKTTETYLSVSANKEDGTFGALSIKTTESQLKSLETLNPAIWKVTAKKSVQGKTVYSFENKVTSLPLAVDASTAIDIKDEDYSTKVVEAKGVTLGGSATEWTEETINGTDYLVSYIDGSTVIYIAKNGKGNLYLEKTALSDVKTNNIVPFTKGDISKDPIDLKANDLNTLLRSVDASDNVAKDLFFGLNMNPEVTSGYKNHLTATSLNAQPSTVEAEAAAGWVYLQAKGLKENGKDAYVVVDTVYYGKDTEAKLLTYTYDHKEHGDKAKRLDGSYKFRFTYNAAEDKLYAQVKEVAHPVTPEQVYQTAGATTDDAKAKAWAAFLKATNNSTWQYLTNEANQYKSSNIKAEEYIYMAQLAGTNVLTVNIEKDENGKGTRAKGAVASKDQNVTMKIGTSFTGLTLTTIPDGVYTIKYKFTGGNQPEKNGSYALANLAGDPGYAYQATRQNFEHMPAAQWVVKKNGSSSTATVAIANREFNDLLKTASMQFFAVKGSDDVFCFYTDRNGRTSIDTLAFTKVADELVKDTKLGYKYVSANEAKIQTYTFNYLHGLSLDKYLFTPAGKDSIVRVDEKDGKSNFRLTLVVEDDKYGFGDGLVRNAYYISDGRGRYITYDEVAKKYMMKSEPTLFFLKENNCNEDGKTYYALVEAMYRTTYITKEDASKWYPGYAGAKTTDEGVKTFAKYYSKNGNPTYKNIDGVEYLCYPGTESPVVTIMYDKDGNLQIRDNSKVKYFAYQANSDGVIALLEAGEDTKESKNYASVKVSVDDNTLDLTQGNLNDKFTWGSQNEIRTSAFAVEIDDSPLYRRFNNAALGETETADSLYFVEKTRGEYLMDEWNKNLQDKTVDYAGIWSKDKAKGKLAFIVDSVWVKRGLGNIKPQYLISVARNDQAGTPGVPCTYEHNHFDNAGNPVSAAECSHATKAHAGFHYGKYLVSFGDSAVANKLNTPYMDIDGGYTRVGFVKAIHSGDSLFILVNEFKDMDPAKLDVADIIAAYTKAKINTKYIVNLQGDNHKNVTWSFRYVTPSKEAGVTAEEGTANEFLFESNIYNENATSVRGNVYVGNDVNKGTISMEGKATKGFSEAVAGSIAPQFGAWLKMQNGCLVLTRGDSQFSAAKTGSDGALIFNAYPKAEEDDMVTSNDEVAVEGVSVIAGNGTVTVQGAAGKSVVITNILGKVIAETVLTSDNATISVPAGIVAVAVDGEEAVKAIVK